MCSQGRVLRAAAVTPKISPRLRCLLFLCLINHISLVDFSLVDSHAAHILSDRAVVLFNRETRHANLGN